MDTFIVMPNHVHGLLALHHPAEQVPALGARTDFQEHVHRGTATGSVGAVVQHFKSTSTRTIKNALSTSAPQALWQRNYYEHIARTEAEVAAIRRYIVDNPRCWRDDENHPALQVRHLVRSSQPR